MRFFSVKVTGSFIIFIKESQGFTKYTYYIMNKEFNLVLDAQLCTEWYPRVGKLVLEPACTKY